ncbi:sensor histidine kinase [Evansella halocellulosilytica]|uniref:sensor histidine kinase n=1 Tax=Evansella halocellulosilytica TaxID=2011013 RepID=UPI001C5492FA|nr:HAMP domain-containing sensor histidine kinase [Evansella halocellulosilytica]
MFVKLFFTYLIILFLSFIFIGLAVNTFVQNEIINRYHNTFDHQKEQMVSFFELADLEVWDEDVIESSLELSMNQEDRMIFLFDSNGKIRYNKNLYEQFDMEMDMDELVLNNDYTAERVHDNNNFVYLISSPIEVLSEAHTMVMIFHEFDRESKQVQSILTMTLLIGIVIAGLIIFLTSRKMTSPLREMNDSALQFAKGNFSHRVKIKTKDEIGQLGETFNYMAKELGSIDQMRKDFVANVSHDLRSPLTSIKGFLGALMDGTIPSDQQYKYFSIMKNETERLMKLVNDLLDMARLEAGQTKINPVSYNLTEQLRLTIARMEPTITQQQIEIELMAEEDVFVVADPNRIDQVLVNLLQNAVQFSNKKSKVDVKIDKGVEEVTVHIRDYGVGMCEEDLNHIWERFYKKEKARSNKGGTGIGLSIVKQIIDLHETSISVHSELNKGTTVTFTLPIDHEKKE